MTKPYFQWAGKQPGERVAFVVGSDGSLSVAVQEGDDRAGVMMSRQAVDGLRTWLGELTRERRHTGPYIPVGDKGTVWDGAGAGESWEGTYPGTGMPESARTELVGEMAIGSSQGYGEFVNAGSTHVCPQCGTATVYQVFSGGKEWYCEGCGADGSYPEGKAPSRAGLLATAEGRAALKEQMHTHLDQLRAKEAGGDAPEGQAD